MPNLEQNIKATAIEAVAAASQMIETTYLLRNKVKHVDPNEKMSEESRQRLANIIEPVIRLARDHAHLTETEIMEAIHAGALKAKARE